LEFGNRPEPEAGPGDKPERCLECGSRDIDTHLASYYCNACGVELRSESRDVEVIEPTASDIIPQGEDPEWAKSILHVPVKIKRPYRLSETVYVPRNREDDPPESRDFSPERDQLRSAEALLGLNRQVEISRVGYYQPFYAVHQGGHSDEDISDRKASRESLPGPVFLLLTTERLPPRMYWLRTSLKDGKPVGLPDWIRPVHRIGFELYFHLNHELHRPWPITLWSKKVRIYGRLPEIIAKGGALGRNGANLVRRAVNPKIGKLDIEGFLENLRRRAVLSIEESGPIVQIAFEIIEVLQSIHPSIGRSYSDLFIEKYCTLTGKAERESPPVFWELDGGLQRRDIGPVRLSSTLIGLAVAEAVNQHNGGSIEALRDIALADATWTSGRTSTNLEIRWAAILNAVGLPSRVTT